MRQVPRPGLSRPAAPLARALVVLTGAACVLVAVLPDPGRPALVAAGLAVAASLAAGVTAWRLLGSVALALTTVAVLLASALDASDLRPGQVVAAALLLTAMVAALDRAESARPAAVTVLRAPAARRTAPLALGCGAALVVAYAAARTVVPSVGLVLAGLAAVVAALVLATRAHRNQTAGPGVGESLSSGGHGGGPR